MDMEYDPYLEDFVSVSCECPAFRSYSGICKHCVAALLSYESSVYNQDAPEGFFESENPFYYQTSLFDYIPSREKKAKQTTPEIRKLLQQQMAKRGLLLSGGYARGQVRLEPCLSCSKDHISLEFKIGNVRMYVLKDIYEFCDNIKNEKKFSYGKQLAFRHTIAAFEPQSQGLVQFILDWAKQNEEQYRDYHYYYSYSYNYSLGYSKIREMILDTYELENFLQAVGDRTF